MNNTKKEKINYRRIAPIIAITFAVGFGVATAASFLIFCDDCIQIKKPFKKISIVDDSRIIPPPPPPPDTKNFTDIGKAKVEFLQKMVFNPIIQEALIESNEKDAQMDPDIQRQIKVQREKEWITAQEPTPFMVSIINNTVSDLLRENHVTVSNKFGVIVFGEHILTNIFGPNVAVSVKTDNYDQSNDNWWKEAEKGGNPFARQCDFDESAQMFSEDIVIKIWDTKGNFIGIMNSATPCDVTQKSAKVEVKIHPIPIENISDIGKEKISKLQELAQNPIIQNALKESNEQFADKNILQMKREIDWPNPYEGDPTPFQLELLNNDVSRFLKENLIIPSDEFDEVAFGEYIITNEFGANIAMTERTFNYIQSEDEWWQVAAQNEILVRQCGWDSSIQMSSEDIIIQIFDENGKFIGILNSATSCNVILVKPPYFYGDSN